jgi:hypothetical protein
MVELWLGLKKVMIWFFELRTCTFSTGIKYKCEDRMSNGWEFLKRKRGKHGKLESLEDALRKAMDAGYAYSMAVC